MSEKCVPQSTVAPAAPVVVYTHPTPVDTYPTYNTRRARHVGVVQVVLGVAMCVVEVVQIPTGESVIGAGLWCSVFTLLAGSFGIASSRKKSACILITTQVLSILAAVSMGVLLAFCSIGLFAIENLMYNHLYDEKYIEYKASSEYHWDLSLQSILIVLAAVELCAAIVQSVFVCKAACCCTEPTVPANAVMVPNQSVAYLEQGQLQGQGYSYGRQYNDGEVKG